MGHEARERSKLILEFPSLGNWVAVMLLIRIGSGGEERGGEGGGAGLGVER